MERAFAAEYNSNKAMYSGSASSARSVGASDTSSRSLGVSSSL